MPHTSRADLRAPFRNHVAWRSSAQHGVGRRLVVGALIVGLLSAASIAGLVGGVEVAIAAQNPVVSCTSDANIFNTGYNSATGGVLPNNTPDPNWQVAGAFDTPNGTTPTTSVSLPPGGTTYAAANVGQVAAGAYSPSPYSNSQWISKETIGGMSPTGDWYYEYQFILAPAVTVSTFRLDMSFMADNDVAEVYVNGVAQSGQTTGLPQTATNPYNYTGYRIANASATTLNHNWQTGQNTIIVQVKSGQPFEGFEAQIRPSAICPVALSVTNTATPSLYAPGQTLTYTVTVSNAGPGNAGGVSVSDPLPAALAGGGFTWTCIATSGGTCAASGSGNIADTASVAAGGTATYTVTGTVPVSASGTLTNTATVTPAPGTSDPGCSPNCGTTNLEPEALPSLTVAKSSPTASYSAVGDVIAYDFLVKNTGNVTLTAITVADTESAPATQANLSAVNCPAPSLAPGAAETCTAGYTVTQADLDHGSVGDAATASGTPPGTATPVSSGGSAGATVPAVQSPALTVAKSSPTTIYSAVGNTIAYDFLVTNTGNVTLSGVTVTDSEIAPATQANLSAINCPGPTLAPNAAETCTAGYTVTQADLDHGSVSDAATASGTPPGAATPVSSASSGPTTVSAAPTTSTATTVNDAGTGLAWSGTEVTGASAYATSTIGGVTNTQPSGTVTYSFFSNGTCAGTATMTDQVTLRADGSVPGSASTAALAPGSYGFRAVYSGDGSYGSSDGACAAFAVVGGPVARIGWPSGAQTYNLGQLVLTGFSCQDALNGPGIASCVDSNGVSSPAGGLDTATVGRHTYVVTARSKNGQSATASIGYVVLGPPVVALRFPVDGVRYVRGQNVRAGYSCQEAVGAPGISSCRGSVAAGSRIDTRLVGSHSFTVTAVSRDGQRATRTVRYRVLLADNGFRVWDRKVQGDGVVTFDAKAPGPGQIDVLETAWITVESLESPVAGPGQGDLTGAGNSEARAARVLLQPAAHHFVFGRLHVRVTRAGTLRLTVPVNVRGREVVADHDDYTLRIRLWITYQPVGGNPRTIGFYGLVVSY